ncbi:sigma-70 family RNA polymerase sigma factor [Patescibacteria group bacterium]|nr:sigma-70 family RNA polymerase sigma factor [Patescibacteria group bacterium]MBU4143046.1 sigma-70 family RNA polymerase sigma factor [Patescibacteria group bacterium]
MANLSEQQFLELYDANVGKIYRYIYFRVGLEEPAQDLTSEVFLKSWQYISQQFNPPRLVSDPASISLGEAGESERAAPLLKGGAGGLKNPRAFFYQVARNLITDFYRQKNKSPISLEEIADRPIVDKADSPSDLAAIALDMASVKKALMRLNDDYREIIIWRYLDELEIKEIAEILDKREGAVRTLLSRALADLKEILNPKS